MTESLKMLKNQIDGSIQIQFLSGWQLNILAPLWLTTSAYPTVDDF